MTNRESKYMTIDKQQLGDLMPNLDCEIDPKELGEFRADTREIIVALKYLSSYAEGKEMAMLSRLSGKIEQAQKFEAACDHVYKQLPEWARW